MDGHLQHLTLNTSNVRRSVRSEVAQEVVDALLPLLDAGGGPVPGIAGWHLTILRPGSANGPEDGAAFFHVADEPGMSRRPVIMGMACWSADKEREAWANATQMYLAMQAPLEAGKAWHAPPAEPPPLPWLVVWLTPFVGIAHHLDLRFFDNLERCLAWAMIP